jgi:hypothetical protein
MWDKPKHRYPPKFFPPIRTYTERTKMTKLHIVEEPLPADKMRISDTEVGDIFKTMDGKICMRVQLCNDFTAPINNQLAIVNLQTGRVWHPAAALMSEWIQLLKATMTITPEK